MTHLNLCDKQKKNNETKISWVSEDNYGNFIQLNFSFKRTYNCSDILFPTTLSLSQYKLRANWITSSPFSLLFIKTLSDWKIQSPQSPFWSCSYSSFHREVYMFKGSSNLGGDDTPWGINAIWFQRLSEMQATCQL